MIVPAAVLCLVLASPPDFVVEKLSGDRLDGALLQCKDDTLQLQTPEGLVSIPLAEVGVVRRRELLPAAVVAPNVPVWVELVGGSTLAATDFVLAQQGAEVVTASGTTVPVPHLQLRAVRFRALNEQSGKQWKDLLASEIDSDLLVVRRNDVLDYHRGTIRAVGAATVDFETAGRRLPVRREKVFGLVFYNSGAAATERPTCSVALRDGTLLAASSVQILDGQLHCTTCSKLVLSYRLDQVARLDFRQTRVVYLSELEPVVSEWEPFFPTNLPLPAVKVFFGPHKDRASDSGPLQLGGRTYRKGLSVHSRTRLVYRLDGKYRRFLATVGIDDRVRPGGLVRLVIRSDNDRVLFDRQIAGTDPPLPIDIDVSGTKQLSIVVDFAEQLDLGDQLDLCEARLIK